MRFQHAPNNWLALTVILTCLIGGIRQLDEYHGIHIVMTMSDIICISYKIDPYGKLYITELKDPNNFALGYPNQKIILSLIQYSYLRMSDPNTLPKNFQISLRPRYNYAIASTKNEEYRTELIKKLTQTTTELIKKGNKVGFYVYNHTPKWDSIASTFNISYNSEKKLMEVRNIIDLSNGDVMVTFYSKTDRLTNMNDKTKEKYYLRFEDIKSEISVFSARAYCYNVNFVLKLVDYIFIASLVKQSSYKPENDLKHPCIPTGEKSEIKISDNERQHVCFKGFIEKYKMESHYNVIGEFDYNNCKKLIWRLLKLMNGRDPTELFWFNFDATTITTPISAHVDVIVEYDVSPSLKQVYQHLTDLNAIIEELARGTIDRLESFRYCFTATIITYFASIFHVHHNEKETLFKIFPSVDVDTKGEILLDERYRKSNFLYDFSKFQEEIIAKLKDEKFKLESELNQQQIAINKLLAKTRVLKTTRKRVENSEQSLTKKIEQLEIKQGLERKEKIILCNLRARLKLRKQNLQTLPEKEKQLQLSLRAKLVEKDSTTKSLKNIIQEIKSNQLSARAGK